MTALTASSLAFGDGQMTVATVQRVDPFALAEAIRPLSIEDVAGLVEAEAEALVAACERISTAVQARASVASAALVHRVQQRLDQEAEEFTRVTGRGQPFVAAGDDLVPSMLAPALRVAPRTVATRVDADCFLVNHLPMTLAAYWAGDLERHRADAVTDHSVSLPEPLRARYETLVLESGVDTETGEATVLSPRVRDLSRSALSRRAAKIARDLDPNHTRAAAEAAHAARTVNAWPAGAPGMTQWSATLPSDTSQRMWAAVDQLATDYVRANPALAVDAARADALADLVLANASVVTTVTLLVPTIALSAALQPSAPPHADPLGSIVTEPSAPIAGAAMCWAVGGMVEDRRVGALLPETVAKLLAEPATLVRLARLDGDGTIATDPHKHDPSAELRRAVQTRDGTCRFPGCHTPANRCDIDHVIEFPRGLTELTNLATLCRRHHLLKHHGGWKPTLASDGVLTWHTPDGRTYTTVPQGRQLLANLGLERTGAVARAPSGAMAVGGKTPNTPNATIVGATVLEAAFAGLVDGSTGAGIRSGLPSDMHFLMRRWTVNLEDNAA